MENIPPDNKCPILDIEPARWTVDHSHYDLYVRGVISQQANTFEGFVSKYFNKFCSSYTELSLSDTLRNLADYLENPYWLENKLHYKGVEDQRKFLERCSKTTISERAMEEFNITLDPDSMTQEEMIVEYLKAFISNHEEQVWSH